MSTIDELVQKIESFADLEEGWDSYGADPISTEAIESAKRLLFQLTEDHRLPDGVSPNTGGGVDLFWIDQTVQTPDLYIDTDQGSRYGYLSIIDDVLTEDDDIGIERALALILEVS